MTTPDAPLAPAALLSPDATALALAEDVVVRWWQVTAFLQVAGLDAPTLLDGLCTQAVERIARGEAVAGLFLDAKAKIIAPAILHRTRDADWHDPRSGETFANSPRLLLETLPELVEPLRAHLSRYRLRAKATIEPVELSTVALVGAKLPDEAPQWHAPGPDEPGGWSIVREQSRPTIAFLGTAEASAAAVRWATSERGFGLADTDAFEADRIERGIASLHDLLPGRMPAEVGGMASAVALDAGCYLGQEPVARLHYRGHANRTLRRLEADGSVQPIAAVDPDAPDAGLELRRADASEGRAVGRLTTWARRADGRTVALATLRREVAEGETLQLAGSDVVLHAVDAADS